MKLGKKLLERTLSQSGFEYLSLPPGDHIPFHLHDCSLVSQDFILRQFRSIIISMSLRYALARLNQVQTSVDF